MRRTAGLLFYCQYRGDSYIPQTLLILLSALFIVAYSNGGSGRGESNSGEAANTFSVSGGKVITQANVTEVRVSIGDAKLVANQLEERQEGIVRLDDF